jgi:hypothetical protein
VLAVGMHAGAEGSGTAVDGPAGLRIWIARAA